MKFILYKGGYKYQLQQTFALASGIKPGQAGGNSFVSLLDTGLLTIHAGYAWDGASGPAINTKTIMRASLVHDALYQLIREGVIPFEARAQADRLFHQIALEDGMWPLRAWWMYQAVRVFGGLYLRGRADEPMVAP